MSESPAPPPGQRKSERLSHSILWYEGFGFAMIILLCWADDLLHLPYYLFGGEYQSHWRSSLLQTEVVVLVWVVVHRLTSKVLGRLHYLERMLRMCAWCRKVNDGEDWVVMEQYFSTKFDTRTSHGMCPSCAETMRAEMRPEAPELDER
ncbi:MAG: hypothetical protein WCF18_12355 [Chthoniobacteraceae bacterium]